MDSKSLFVASVQRERGWESVSPVKGFSSVAWEGPLAACLKEGASLGWELESALSVEGFSTVVWEGFLAVRPKGVAGPVLMAHT